MSIIERYLNFIVVLILSGVLLGALGIQTFTDATPCPLCLLQRMGMIGVAIAALLNIHFGSKSSHYGLMLLSAMTGCAVAIRQILLHICPTFVVLMLFFRQEPSLNGKEPEKDKLGTFGFALMFVIICLNIIATGFECGVGFCPN